MNPLTQSKKTTILPLLMALALACFGLLPATQAVLPPPDGGYPNENTAEGDFALLNLTTGFDNTPSVLVRSIATQPALATRPLERPPF
jgi:hypothetical protein